MIKGDIIFSITARNGFGEFLYDFILILELNKNYVKMLELDGTRNTTLIISEFGISNKNINDFLIYNNYIKPLLKLDEKDLNDIIRSIFSREIDIR